MYGTVTCLGALAMACIQSDSEVYSSWLCTLTAAKLPTKYACDNAPDLERDIVRSASSVSVGMTVAPVRETNLQAKHVSARSDTCRSVVAATMSVSLLCR